MHRFFVLFLLALLVSCTATGGNPHAGHGFMEHRSTPSPIQWHTLSEGKKISLETGKPAVIDFYTAEECPRCRKMDRDVYSDPEVIRRLNTEFVAIRIDLAKDLTPGEKAVGDKFGYMEECLLVFMTPDGEAVKDPAGKKLCFAEAIDVKWFLSYLDATLDAMKQAPNKTGVKR